MPVTDDLALNRLFALPYWEQKKLFAEYKCTISFDTLEQMVAHVAAAGIPLHGFDNSRLPVSEIITGNCLVMRSAPNFIFKQEKFLSYVICPSGKPCLLRLGTIHAGSVDEAIAWLSSPEFAENKSQIIAENDAELHEHDYEATVRIAGGNESDPTVAMHKRFFAGFLPWERSRPQSVLFGEENPD
jgi:hypothetical protein